MFINGTTITVTWAIDQDQAADTRLQMDLQTTDPSGNVTYEEGTASGPDWMDAYTAPVAATSAGSITATVTPNQAGVWTYILAVGLDGDFAILSTTLIMVVDVDTTHAVSVSS